MPISLLFTDDHELLRKTWCSILNTDQRFRVIACCTTGEEAVQETKRLRPDIVVMDINLPGIDGFEATRQILKEVPETKVLGYSLHVEPFYAGRMIEEGAMGYVAKTGSIEEMKKALLSLYNNQPYLCKAMAEKREAPDAMHFPDSN